jgi:hypothetical protein
MKTQAIVEVFGPVKMKEEDEYRKPAAEKLTTLTLI